MKNYLFLFVFILAACEAEVSEPAVQDDIELNYELLDCVSVEASAETLEVLTWNIENYPTNPSFTPEYVLGTIVGSEFDLYGLQEIENPYYIRIIESVSNYKTIIDDDIFSGINDDYHLGYVYNTETLNLIDATVLTGEEFDSYYFPRRPLLGVFENLENGDEFIVINLHLKCCGGDTNNARRTEASKRLKAFIDREYPDSKVIVLGDFNGVIYPEQDSNFENFIQDSEDYFFADMSIATGDDEFWSYPSYPSHIDHILLSDEWYMIYVNSVTLRVDLCDSRYSSFISDHRPVLTLLNN